MRQQAAGAEDGTGELAPLQRGAPQEHNGACSHRLHLNRLGPHHQSVNRSSTTMEVSICSAGRFEFMHAAHAADILSTPA